MVKELGFTAEQQRVYELLLTRPSWTERELAAVAGRARAELPELLGLLERHGLLTHRPGPPPRWLPVPPDTAIEAFIAHHHERLQRLRELIPAMTAIYHRGHEGSRESGPIQTILGRGCINECWDRLQRAARREVCQFERPPYAAVEANETAVSVQAGGISYRTVYDESFLDNEGIRDDLHSRRQRGELIRTWPRLPTKLCIVDRRWALLPVSSGSETESALLVHTSALLSGLVTLFESCWQRATPLATVDSSRPVAVDRRLLMLLAAGMTDKNIASRLDISLRTTQRRVQELLGMVGARSRFQAGVRAAQLGMLDATELAGVDRSRSRADVDQSAHRRDSPPFGYS